ncbi:unnamed protein product, partial [Nesidiocoris tenuis]
MSENVFYDNLEICSELIADQSGVLDENWDALMPHLLELNFTASPAKQLQIVHQLKEHYLGGKKIRQNPGGVTQVLGAQKVYHFSMQIFGPNQLAYRVSALGRSLLLQWHSRCGQTARRIRLVERLRLPIFLRRSAKASERLWDRRPLQ